MANPCRGFEIMNMIRKGKYTEWAKGDVEGQITLVSQLFGVAA
jgi:hypothetical protein